MQRLGWGAILLGAGCGAGATAWRDALSVAAQQRGATYLLDTLGLVFAVIGAVLVARVYGMLFDHAPRRVLRRVGCLTAVGLLVGVAGCAVLGLAGSGGGLGLAWTVGLRYAADRLDSRDRDL